MDVVRAIEASPPRDEAMARESFLALAQSHEAAAQGAGGLLSRSAFVSLLQLAGAGGGTSGTNAAATTGGDGAGSRVWGGGADSADRGSGAAPEHGAPSSALDPVRYATDWKKVPQRGAARPGALDPGPFLALPRGRRCRDDKAGNRSGRGP